MFLKSLAYKIKPSILGRLGIKLKKQEALTKNIINMAIKINRSILNDECAWCEAYVAWKFKIEQQDACLHVTAMLDEQENNYSCGFHEKYLLEDLKFLEEVVKGRVGI